MTSEHLLAMHWRSLVDLEWMRRFEERLVRNALKRVNHQLITNALKSGEPPEKVKLVEALRPAISEQLGAGLAGQLQIVLVTYRDVGTVSKTTSHVTLPAKVPASPGGTTMDAPIVVSYPGSGRVFQEWIKGPLAGRIVLMADRRRAPFVVRPSDSEVFLRVVLISTKDGE